MKKRIYTDKEAALSFSSQVLTFNDQALIFWVKGLTHFDVNAFTYAEAEMGAATISLDLMVEPSITPAFDRSWYVDFRGERYLLSTLTPSCVKDTSSLKYKYSLIFKSERANLERYEFANFVTAGSVQQPVSYDFALPVTVAEFVERMNINLDYYFGTGKWQMILDPSCLDEYGNVVNNINTAIYDGTSAVTVSFSRETLWSLLTGLYDVFGLRWKISSEGGIMTIRLGYTPITLKHTFEYGKDKGLISIERINSNPTVYTRLSGKGSDRNLPYRYYDTAASGYKADPDNNIYTRDIPYSALMPKSYRDYVQGWNNHAASQPASSSTYAYEKGYTDTVFNPVDYVIDEAAELIYGVRKGSVADSSDIYPTLQGATDPVLGRLDEVVAVEPVLNDDTTQVVSNQNLTDNISLQKYVEANSAISAQFDSSTFVIAAPYNKITFSLTQSFTGEGLTPYFDSNVQVSLMHDTTEDASVVVSGLNPDGPYPVAIAEEFLDVSPGTYYLRCLWTVDNTQTGYPVTVITGLGDIKKNESTPYKQTFDIWIKNIWQSQYQDASHASETEDEYMHRVWDPLFVPNKEMSVYFSDGLLAGEDYEFVVAKREGTNNYYIYHDETETNSHWRLSLIKSDVNFKATGLMLPNMTICATHGDHFFFTNIELAHNPYVLDAEERLEIFLENELLKVNNENPTYAIKPSSIFLETYAENSSVQIGNKIPLYDEHILGNSSVGLSITNLTIEYKADKLLPEWNVTIAEKPTTTKNSIQVIQGDIKVLSNNLLSAQELTSQVQLSLDSRYLRRDGAKTTSQSPTIFDREIKADVGVASSDFASGQISGTGYSIFKDANGDYVLEIDKLNIRKTLYASELVINQVSIYGGIHLYSAAAMTVSKVEDTITGYKCYLDIKQGTVFNQFVVGDYAYCKRFEPLDPNSIIKYYWKSVVGIGYDYIEISSSGGDGSGIPEVGDNISQLGNASDIRRQSALIIDQTNGGSVTQYAKVSDTSLGGKEYIAYGVDPSTGRAYERIYGDLYVGGRNPAIHNYFKFDSSVGELSFRGIIRQESMIENPDGTASEIVAYKGVYDPDAYYYKGHIVTWNGVAYYCDIAAHGIPPSNTGHWHIWVDKGETGASGADARKVDLTATAWAASFDAAGNLIEPSSITLTATAYNFVETPYFQFFEGDASLGLPSTNNTKVYGLSGKIFNNMPLTLKVQVREGAADGLIMATDENSFIGVIPGTDGVSVLLSNQNHSMPADAYGNVTSYAGSGTTIQVYEGSTLLEYNTVLAAGKFAAGTPTISPAGAITVGNITGDGTTTLTVANASAISAAQDVVTIIFPLTIRRLDGRELSYSVVQTITKSKTGATGADGADGTAARVVHLLAPTTVVRYNSGGLIPNPGSIDITAVASNTTGTVWYEFIKDNVAIQNTTSNTYSYTPPTLASNMPDMIQVNIRENSNTGEVVASDMVQIIGLVANSGIIHVAQSNPFVQFAADYTGSISDYSKSSEIVRVYEGDQILTPVPTESEPSNGEWLISYVQPVNINAGGRSIDGNDLEIGAASNMTTDTARIDYSIHGVRPDGRNFDTSFYQGFARFKDGADGKGYEYIYTKTISSSVPATPADGQTKNPLSPATTYQDDDWFPVNWTDDFTPPDSTYIYAWISKRIKINGIWDLFSTPKIYQTYVTNGTNGYDGTDGADARKVDILAATNAVKYNAAGLIPDPSSILITADVHNTTGVVFYEFLIDSSTVQNSSINTYTYTPKADAVNMPETIQVNIREGSTSNPIMASDITSIVALIDQSTFIQAVQSNQYVGLVADYEGDVADYSESGEVVNIYEGDEVLAPIPSGYEPAQGQWKVVSVSAVNISAGIRAISGNDLNIGPASGMIADYARVEYSVQGVRFDGRDFSLTFSQRFTKTKDGADGKGYEYIFSLTQTSAAPTTPNSTMTKNASSPALNYQDDDWYPVGWYDNPQTTTSNLPYLWVSIRRKINGVYEDPFSTPEIYTTFVTNGADGLPAVVMSLSQDSFVVSCNAAGDPRTGTIPHDIYVYTFVGGQLTDDSGLFSVTPASSSDLAYSVTNISAGKKKIQITAISVEKKDLTITAELDNGGANFVTVTKILTVSKQLDGYAGPGLISRGAWNAATQYTGSIQTVDVVSRKPSTSFIWYQAKTTAGSIPVGNEPGITPGWGTYWIQLDSYSSIATDTLFAEDANVAEFIFNAGKLISQYGTINGDPSTNYGHSNYVPNLILNGVTGDINSRTGHIGGFEIGSDTLVSTAKDASNNPLIKLINSTGGAELRNALIQGLFTSKAAGNRRCVIDPDSGDLTMYDSLNRIVVKIAFDGTDSGRVSNWVYLYSYANSAATTPDKVTRLAPNEVYIYDSTSSPTKKVYLTSGGIEFFEGSTSTLNIKGNVPTSPDGQFVGTVYRDGSTLKIKIS